VSLHCPVGLSEAGATVVCTVKKKSPSERKFFTHVTIVMSYMFYLFHVMTVVYNGGCCFYIENVQHCK
jgi:hypothetical protein